MRAPKEHAAFLGALGIPFLYHIWARKVSGYSVKDSAEHFLREPMTISQAIIRLEDCIRRERDVEETVTLLGGTLREKGGKKYSSRIAWRYFRVFLIELLVFL